MWRAAGEFTRDTRYITTRITRDGRDGYLVEPGRYRFVAARACPWANRAMIVRQRCGFPGSRAAYDTAFDRLFNGLDWLSEWLATQRYLVGDTLTETDVRLFTTLVRFDPVYHGHFKCNRSKLTEMPVLWVT